MSIDFSHLRCNNISNLCTITGSVRTVEIKLYFKLIIPSPVFFLLFVFLGFEAIAAFRSVALSLL